MELNTLCETAETEEVYDIQDGRATIQELGVVDIRQGRMIAFPNVFVPLVPHGRVIAENGTDLPHQAECASSPGQNT